MKRMKLLAITLCTSPPFFCSINLGPTTPSPKREFLQHFAVHSRAAVTLKSVIDIKRMSLAQASRYSLLARTLCSTKIPCPTASHTISAVKLASSTKKTFTSPAPFPRPSPSPNSAAPRFSPAIDRSKQYLNHLSPKSTFATSSEGMSKLTAQLSSSVGH